MQELLRMTRRNTFTAGQLSRIRRDNLSIDSVWTRVFDGLDLSYGQRHCAEKSLSRGILLSTRYFGQ